MVYVRKPQDVGAAVLMLFFGSAGLWFGREYPVGTASRMGPGYMPMALSWGLIIFGAVIGLRSFGFRATGESGPGIEKIVWRTNILVLSAIVSFAVLIRWAGLAPATFAATFLSALASRESDWKEIIGLAVFLSVLCALVFVYGLRQSIPVFGG
jgi:hypothetical protein